MADRVHPAVDDSPSAPPLLVRGESVSIQMVPEKVIRKEQEQSLIASHHREPSAAKKDIIYSTPTPLPPDHPSNRRSGRSGGGGGGGGGGSRKSRRRRSPCCCCLVSFIATLLTIAVILGLAAGILWLVLKPKAPEFEVTDAKVSKLVLKAAPSSTTTSSGTTTPWLDASVSFTVQAGNPNKKIGIRYETVDVTLSYEGQEIIIGQGSVPGFYQGHGNVTLVTLDMEGSDISLSADTAASLNSTLSDSSSHLSFGVRAEARVRVRVGSWTSGPCGVRVNCDVVTTSPTSASNPSVSLVSKSCSFKLKSVKLF